MDTSVVDINLDSTYDTYSKDPLFEKKTEKEQSKVKYLKLITKQNKILKKEQEMVDTPKNILTCYKDLYKSDLESKLNIKFPSNYFHSSKQVQMSNLQMSFNFLCYE